MWTCSKVPTPAQEGTCKWNTGKLVILCSFKLKIKNLDPNSVMDRIFEHPDTEKVLFQGFID